MVSKIITKFILIRFEFLEVWNLLAKDREARNSENSEPVWFNQQKLIKFFTEVGFKPIRLIISVLLLCFSLSTQAMFAPQAYCPMDLYMLALMGGAQDNSKQVDSDKELRDRLKEIEKNIDALLETMDDVQADLEDTLGDDGSIIDQVLEFEDSEWEQKDGDEAYCSEEELEALGVETEAEWGGAVSSIDSANIYTLASISKKPGFFQLSFLEAFTEKALFTLIPSAGAVAITRDNCDQYGGDWKKLVGQRRLGCYCPDGVKITDSNRPCELPPPKIDCVRPELKNVAPGQTCDNPKGNCLNNGQCKCNDNNIDHGDKCVIECSDECKKPNAAGDRCVNENNNTSCPSGVCRNGECKARASCNASKCQIVDPADNTKCKSQCDSRNQVCMSGTCEARCDRQKCNDECGVCDFRTNKCNPKNCPGNRVCKKKSEGGSGRCEAPAPTCDASKCEEVDSSDPTKCKSKCTEVQVCDGGACKAPDPNPPGGQSPCSSPETIEIGPGEKCDNKSVTRGENRDCIHIEGKCICKSNNEKIAHGAECEAPAPTCDASTCKSEECKECDGDECKAKECPSGQTCKTVSAGGSGQCEAPAPPQSPIKDCKADNTCEEVGKECAQTGSTDAGNVEKKCISSKCKDWLTWRKCGGKKLTRSGTRSTRAGRSGRSSRRRSRDHKGYVADICKRPSSCTEITTSLNPTPWNARESRKCSKYLASLKKIRRQLEELEKERERIEEELWDKRMAKLLGEQETEASAATCFECNIRRMKELRSALNPPPTGWQILGDVLTTLGGAYVGYRGVRHANELRDQQGFSAQPGLALNLAYPFIMKGLYGSGLMGSSASLACSPTAFNSMFPGSVFMNPFIHGGGMPGWPGGIPGGFGGGFGGFPGGFGGFPGGFGGGFPGGGFGIAGVFSGGFGGGYPGGFGGGFGGFPGGFGGFPGGGFGIAGVFSGGFGGGYPGGFGGGFGGMPGGFGGFPGGFGGGFGGGYPGGFGGGFGGMPGGFGGFPGGFGGGFPGGFGGGFGGMPGGFGGMGGMGGMMPGMARYQHQMQAYMEYQQAMMAYRMAEMQNWQQKQQVASTLYQEIFKIQMQIQQIMYGGIGGGIASFNIGGFGGFGSFGGGGGSGGGGSPDDDDIYTETPGRY